MTESLRRAWEHEAEAWAAWARAPGHDAFWHFTLPQLLEIVPPPGELTVDLGCGEGRLDRELRARGHRVVGVDSSPTLARLAAEHEDPTTAVLADAVALPIRAGAADLVVACLSLQDVDDLDGAVREAARVLTPAGRLCVAIVHPLNSSGRFSGDGADAPFVVEHYLEERRYSDAIERDGLAMTFHSMHRPFEAYVGAFERAGLAVEALREPSWAAPVGASRWEGWDRIPLMCFLRAVPGAGRAQPN